ncbi:MAG TPA: hypothetical protein PKA62_14080, partial [Thermoanaerobaculia bacterium]|nr:hypothetical protein [Thermoanaerobaculia bacterium]
MRIDERERRFPRRAAAAALLALAPFWNGAALGSDAGVRVTVPIESGERQPQALPQAEKGELTPSHPVQLRNTLDLDVASLTYERSAFGLGAAEGIFDPTLSASVETSSRKSPQTRSFQSDVSKTQSFDLGIGGLTAYGTRYSLGFGGTRSDSPTNTSIPGYVEINPTFS